MSSALILFILLIQQAGIQDSSSPGALNNNRIGRNPFRPYSAKEIQATDTSALSENLSAPIIKNATAEETVIPPVPPTISPILNQLRSIAISGDGTKLAMFGRRIVSTGEEISGFIVTDITLDEVTLRNQSTVITRKIEEISSPRYSWDKAPLAPGISGSANPLDFLSSGAADDPRFTNVANMVQKVKSLNDMLKPIIGDQINLDGLSGFLK